jgi:hypothetical protein
LQETGNLESIRTKTSDKGDQAEMTEGGTRKRTDDSTPDARGPRVDVVSDERLVQLFSRPRSPKQFLAGLRVLGFSADAVEFMTGAKSRDVVYSWAAGRARPGLLQAKRIDEIRRVLYFICAHAELGPDTAWMLFNAKFATMSHDGPTAMELIARGGASEVMRHLESLVEEDGGEDGGEKPLDPDLPAEPPGGEHRQQSARAKR